MRKSVTQKQHEKQDLLRYSNPFGNVGPDVNKLLVIYARQSSTRQFVENVYSAEQQKEGLERYARDTLHWRGPIKVLIENELAEKTSGTLPTDSRPGLLKRLFLHLPVKIMMWLLSPCQTTLTLNTQLVKTHPGL